jgi:radical SAM protein (TIGR01212 family)
VLFFRDKIMNKIPYWWLSCCLFTTQVFAEPSPAVINPEQLSELPSLDGRVALPTSKAAPGTLTMGDAVNRAVNWHPSIREAIAEQLAHQASRVNRARQYLAYFQAYTSTWAEVQVLRSMYQQAVSQANIVGLCVGTRPDCVPEAVLDLLSEYKALGYEIWLELGLQTAHDKTLHRINRGHDFACYQRTTRLARERGLKVCSHLIVGLPGEGRQHSLETLERVVDTGVDGIKLHPLHIVTGSIMARAWEAGRLNGIELDEYTATAGEMIRRTPPEVVYHRISASARRPTLLAPLWCENRWTGMVEIDKYLNAHGVQGSALGRPWVPPLSSTAA